jgi:hypothetical protein
VGQVGYLKRTYFVLRTISGPLKIFAMVIAEEKKKKRM